MPCHGRIATACAPRQAAARRRIVRRGQAAFDDRAGAHLAQRGRPRIGRSEPCAQLQVARMLEDRFPQAAELLEDVAGGMAVLAQVRVHDAGGAVACRPPAGHGMAVRPRRLTSSVASPLNGCRGIASGRPPGPTVRGPRGDIRHPDDESPIPSSRRWFCSCGAADRVRLPSVHRVPYR
jgi:hypothetical protein